MNKVASETNPKILPSWMAARTLRASSGSTWPGHLSGLWITLQTLVSNVTRGGMGPDMKHRGRVEGALNLGFCQEIAKGIASAKTDLLRGATLRTAFVYQVA
jgi:hypothetical protein